MAAAHDDVVVYLDGGMDGEDASEPARLIGEIGRAPEVEGDQALRREETLHVAQEGRAQHAMRHLARGVEVHRDEVERLDAAPREYEGVLMHDAHVGASARPNSWGARKITAGSRSTPTMGSGS